MKSFMIITHILLYNLSFSACEYQPPEQQQQQVQQPQQPNQQSKHDPETTNTKSFSSITSCFQYGCPFHPMDLIDPNVRNSIQQIKQRDGSSSSDDESSSSSFSPVGRQTVVVKEGNSKATLTLMGYKGGDIQNQINQDRAFVVSPYRLFDSSSQDDDEEEDPSSNQDSQTTVENDDILLLGVFDGHGKLGEVVSDYTVNELPKRLATKLQTTHSNNNNDDDDNVIKQALQETFLEIDSTIPTEGIGGCTASIILKLHSKLYIANAGDSRSFVATYSKGTTNLAYISREDKPHLPKEMERVQRMGGRIYIPPPHRADASTSRVFATNSRTGETSGLAMSRSIGDWSHGDVGVIADPIVDVISLESLVVQSPQECRADGSSDAEECRTDEPSSGPVHVFAVSATDGLLDMIQPQTIADVIGKSLYMGDGEVEEGGYVQQRHHHPLVACEELIMAAAKLWGNRYRDDIAIAVSQIATLE